MNTLKAKRTDNPQLNRDWLCKLVFAVDGARGEGYAPEHLTELVEAIERGSLDDIQREITNLSLGVAPEVRL